MMTALIGTRLGPYEILAPLAAGGMGEVYRARDTRLGREVAVKILSERLAGNSQALARFEREARVVASLSHPNILALHDSGRENTIVFAVMELLDGEALDRRIAREEISWKKALEIGAAIADGLASAHAKGIIHRDLKPANIFLTRTGHVKILDFGLATLGPFDPDGKTTAERDGAETEPGVVVGTVGYMSPEQVRGETADPRGDIFSLGCVMYEMLTARRAFRGETAAETMAAILRDHPAELTDSGRKVPPHIDAVVGRCLEKSPDERFQSARDLAFALREILGAASGSTIDAPRALASRSRATVAAAAAVLLAAVAASAMLDVGGVRSRFLHGATGRVQSLVVLPLRNLSADTDQEYFADAMTEQLITDIARLGKLRVTSRSSAMIYKGTKKTPGQIARELGVDAAVEGSVVRTGSNLTLNAQLIDLATDKVLWAASFERDVRDVLGLQREVAQTIARKIELELTPEDRARAKNAEGRRIDPDAYDAYVKGRYFLDKRTELDLKRAINLFQQALDGDPTYGAAYAGMADAYGQLGYGSYVAPGESFPLARGAAQKALVLDPTLADAHASLGFALMYYDWNFTGAEAEFKRSIQLNGSYAMAHQWYAYLLTAMERPSTEAEREIAIAKRLDPLSVPINTDQAFVLYYHGRVEDALKAVNTALSMNPKFPLGVCAAETRRVGRTY